MADLIWLGITNVMTVSNLLAIGIGVLIGLTFGSMPGLSGATAMSMLLPLTFLLAPDTGVLFLISIWGAAVYAGSITAICLNIPGTAAAAATTIEGHALSQRGLARRALRASIVGSVIGGFASALALLFLAPPLAELAISSGPAEMFAFAMFGMAAVTSLSSGSFLRGAISTVIGLLIATVGIAPSGQMRLVVFPELMTGFPLIPTLIGAFTIPVVLDMIRENRPRIALDLKMLSQKDDFLTKVSDWTTHWFNFVRSAVIGVVIGVLPGAGPTVASYISYGEARRAAKPGHEFGRGDIAGVIAPETANNAAVFSSLVPALTLGIPGSIDAAIIMAALTMHGLVPGPLLIERSADVAYTVFMGAFFANGFMLIAGLFGARLIANITRVRLSLLAPLILTLALLGAFSVHNDVFDVYITLAVGFLAYGMRLLQIPVAPMILAVILGDILETYFVQAVVLYDGILLALVTRPISAVLLVLTIASVVWSLRKEIVLNRQAKDEEKARGVIADPAEQTAKGE